VSQCSYGPGYTDVDGWSRNTISALCNVVERRRRTDVVDTMRVRGLLAAVVVLVRSLADVVRSARPPPPYDALTTPVNLTAVRDPVHFYRAMLCIRGTSHGPVSVRLSVRHKSEFY